MPILISLILIILFFKILKISGLETLKHFIKISKQFVKVKFKSKKPNVIIKDPFAIFATEWLPKI